MAADLNIELTQFMQAGSGPLRRSFLDYSRLSFASELDSIGATVCIIALSALIVNVIFLFGGLCTHSAALSSMVRGCFISDCLIKTLFRGSECKRADYRRNVRLKVLGAFLVSSVFVMDVLLTLSQTTRCEIVSAQQLEVRRPAIKLYDGDNKYFKARSDCVALVNS